MKQPPRWIEKLLRRFIDPSLYDEVHGDMLEDYHYNVKHGGITAAKWKFILSAAGYFRYMHLLRFNRSTHNSTSMDIWKNYFISSYRNLARNKRYTAISLLGLVVGFASAIAILQYAFYESSYDSFHGEPIFRLTHTFTNNSGVSEGASTLMAMKEALLSEVPEVNKVTHFLSTGGTVKVQEEIYSGENIVGAAPDFFDVFRFRILGGNAVELDNPDVIFISESTASKYFGPEDALNQVVEMQGIFGQTWDARVGGVFEDIPMNSHLRIDIIFSETKILTAFREGNFFGNITFQEIPWRLLGFPTYVILEPGASHEQVISKANELIAINREAINKELDQKHEVWLQPVSEIHTTPGIQSEMSPTNDRKVILLFTFIAIFILAIAWINYINMATARSVTRGKEVGVRKVLGSHRKQLRNQFLLEAFILNAFGLFLSLLLVIPAAPYLEEIVGVRFFHTMWTNSELIIFIIGVLFLGSFVSGIYPAFTLSNFDCLEVIKGKLKYSSKGVILRRILVVSQFVFSIFLIAALLIVQSQMNFMLNHNLGISIDRTFLVSASGGASEPDNYPSKMRALVNEFMEIPGVESVSVSSIVPGIVNQWRNSTERRTGEGAGLFIHRSIIDENFMDLYEIDIIAGRNVSKSFANDGQSLIVNETTRKRLGYNSPEDILNEKIYFAGLEYNVIGVVDDFYQRGAHFAYEPMSFQLDTTLTGGFISIKFNTGNLRDLLSGIEDKFKSAFPDAPYNGRFLDTIFQNQYTAEFRFRNLFTIFSTIALLIACLGLAGLSSYIINQKMKEISIRKVLGASGSNLFVLLNKEYLVISILAFLGAGPAIYFLSPVWLQNFENRINVHPGFYIVPLVIITSVVLLTTISYTLRAIHVNPSRMLKEE